MTTGRIPYAYVPLRYVHDTTTGEFLNVGIVVMTKDGTYIGSKFNQTYGRLKTAFPSLNGESYRNRLRKIQQSFERLKPSREGELPLEPVPELMTLARRILPFDDSSLQWGPVGTGITKDPAATLDIVYQRFVSLASEPSAQKRKDDDVWKTFRAELERRRLAEYFEPKTIEAPDDAVEFQHAWKNGAWHCVEPLSFDLDSSNGIREKAHRWVGVIASIADARERFQVYFVTGRPTDQGLAAEYERAKKLLVKAGHATVVDESDVEALTNDFADRIDAHNARRHS